MIDCAQLFKEVLAAAGGTVAFSVLFRVAPRHYGCCGFVGGLGWLVYGLVTYSTGSAVLGTFLATLVLTACSRWFSTLRRTPTLVFLVCGIFPLVPGSTIYNTAYHFFMNHSAEASAAAAHTLKLAAAIGLGILVAYSLPNRMFGWNRNVDTRDSSPLYGPKEEGVDKPAP